MAKLRLLHLLFFGGALLMSACRRDANPILSVSLHFDPAQQRLDNFGNPSVVPAGHAAQTPDFHRMSVHYIELVASENTALGQGVIVYKGAETTAGGDAAVDFDKAAIAGNDEVLTNIDLSGIPAGAYRYVRASVTYQNYDVRFNLVNVPVIGTLNQQNGAIASFVGFNSYITTVTPKSKTLTVNANKKQGFWAFETDLSSPYQSYDALYSGQAPVGATTVVNPLFLSSPIPAGSCVVTGALAQPLVIGDNPTQNLNLKLSFSINNSFEWVDSNGNGQLDVDAANPGASEQVVDMGLRGLIPSWQ